MYLGIKYSFDRIINKSNKNNFETHYYQHIIKAHCRLEY